MIIIFSTILFMLIVVLFFVLWFMLVEGFGNFKIPAFFIVGLLAVGIITTSWFLVTTKKQKDFDKKYSKDDVFYQVEYNKQTFIMVNPQVKDNVLSDNVMLLHAPNGYMKISREKAMKFLK